MAFPGHSQDHSRLVAPCLISPIDDINIAQTEEVKLIDDSECHYQGLSSSRITSYHEDLSSLFAVPDAERSSTIQYSESTLAWPQSSTANQLVEREDQLISSDTNTLSMPPSKYVDSLTSFRLSVNPGAAQKQSVENDDPLVRGCSSSMCTPDVRKREVQTLSTALSVSSEAVSHGTIALSKSTILAPKTEIDSPKDVVFTTSDLYATTAELSSLIATSTELVSATSSLSDMPPSTDFSMDRNEAPDKQAVITALETRTAEDVIADLRHPSRPSFRPHENKQHSSSSDLPPGSHFSNPTDMEFDREAKETSHESDGQEDDRDEDDEVAPSTKKRKISERKRRMNAIADRYILTLMEKSAEKDNEVKPEDEARQSTRWLVNQSENREIISSPREYQTELFERAKARNIIAVLDTGTGKTLIAVLLLRYIFALELENRELGKPKRISFFLVDSVTLVFQQHAVLKANLDQPMDMFCGDMGCDLWSKERWKDHFDKNMVIVCTAEVLRQCLHHSFISMADINLLIFDEAHHAKKDHTYARIIKDFYVSDEERCTLPKIFGMTASPVDARADVKQAAAELEALLHCEIATAKDGALTGYTITSKQELLAKYPTLGPKFETPLYQIMFERLKTNPIFKKPLIYSHQASKDLGAWCSDQTWNFCLTEDEVKKLLATTERNYHSRKGGELLEVVEKRKAQIHEAQDIVKAWNFEEPHFDASGFSNNLSSKVVLLVQYLKERFERPTDDKVIVFVRERYTARLLAHLISFANIGTPHLRAGTLVGTRTGDAGDLHVSFRQQVLTMMNFRKSIVNCLFATSVAEEGLDIPDCNLVVRFDLYTTMIQYIQSRGRARQVNSRYVHMYEENNLDHSQIIREVRVNESVLKNFCQQLPEDRLLTGCSFDMDHFLAKEKSHRVYKVPETGAKLTYKISLMVLANFVDSLPHGPDVFPRPEYVMTMEGKQFICEVILPESSPIRGAVGKPCSTKQVAKCSAAFDTCLLLRRGKYLDEWLLPIFTKQLPAMRNALLAVDSKKREAYEMRTKPEMWTAGTTPEEFFLNIINLDSPECLGRPSQPLGLLTRLPLPELPSFPLHFGSGKTSKVLVTSYRQPLKLKAGSLEQINLFTLRIFDDVFSKGYESNVSQMPYFLVPVKSHSPIDQYSDISVVISWDILESTQYRHNKWADNFWENKDWRDAPDDFFLDKFIVDPWDGSRKMWSVGVDHRFKPLDPVPANAAPRTGARKNNDNIMEYSCSLWSKARARRKFDESQRVIEAKYISLRRNLLDEFDASEVESPKQCWVIPEPLKISPLPATVVAMAYLFPAVIHRVESYLIALEACALLHLEVRPDLALEAITKDSDNSGEHDSEKINFQRGMGNNYERLEFIGDCFLKMATTISLFGMHPDNDEYAYHVDRMVLICNKNLRNNAIKLNLYEYIRSQSFNRRAWYPEGLVLRKGKTAKAPDSHKLGDKTIADVCEAMIGAALLTFQNSGDMDNAVRAVTELVSSENHRVTKFSDYYKLYKKPKYQTTVATADQRGLARQVEKKHAYHFEYPRLLRSAFIHPSYPFSYEHIPSYQRLEFLGDALFDMVCVNFLYHEFPAYDPQWLTEHKMAMVSNQFLGALCVSLGFHSHILHFTPVLQKNILDYVTDITEARTQAEDDAIQAGKTRDECSPSYWISVRQPPKCLPDIVEAYIGAMFVDSGYNYREVERFFDEHIRWFFKDMSIYDSFANKHPTTFLSKFLQVNMGCMDWSIFTREIPTVDGSMPYVVAVVIVHSQVVTDHKAESSRYAKVGAAKKAMGLLQGLPLPEFREQYACDCRIEEVEAEDHIHGTAI